MNKGGDKAPQPCPFVPPGFVAGHHPPTRPNPGTVEPNPPVCLLLVPRKTPWLRKRIACIKRCQKREDPYRPVCWQLPWRSGIFEDATCSNHRA
jgi:hypothetical protein